MPPESEYCSITYKTKLVLLKFNSKPEYKNARGHCKLCKKGEKKNHVFLSLLLLEGRKLLGWGKEWNGASKYA